MIRSGPSLAHFPLVAILLATMGCAAVRQERSDRPIAGWEAGEHRGAVDAGASEASGIQQADQREISPGQPLEQGLPPSGIPFPVDGELALEELIREVLARNPTLGQMTAAWQAASSRYPQVTSLDDPVFSGTVGPGSIGSTMVDFAYRVEFSQKFPFPGKLGLKGKAALAEAAATGNEVEDTRLQLEESAKASYIEYYLVDRALAVNEENLKRLKEARQTAESRARTGLAPVQDIRQADVEIGRQQERELVLQRMREVAIARINTLMNLPPDSALPLPPRRLKPAAKLPEVADLRGLALARRPDLLALAARVEAEQAALALAYREYYPDMEVMAAYDAFWQAPEQALRPQLAVRMNLPVRSARRHGAVAEARARVALRRAELDRQTSQVSFQVQDGHAQVREGEKVVRLYEKTILPAAEANVEEALATYSTGKIPFLSLIEAQRNLIGLRDRYYEALADSFRRRAMLERVVGGALEAGDDQPGRD